MTASSSFLLEYLPILIFLEIAVAIAAAMILASYVVAPQKPEPAKISAYECGFDAFEDARMKFDVRFYLVAILFIIFDLEVAFLFPWADSFSGIGLYGFWSMLVLRGPLLAKPRTSWRFSASSQKPRTASAGLALGTPGLTVVLSPWPRKSKRSTA